MTVWTATGAQAALTALGDVSVPAFLMNVPYSLRFDVPNNATMMGLSAEERVLDLDKAVAQFQALYQFMTEHGFVYLLPSVAGLQDQTYVSNVGALLPHLDEPTIILSNFRSKPRVGEEVIAKAFLQMMGFEVIKAPHFFEGEADLKHLRDNVYFGAHGMRTSRQSLDWLEAEFGMRIIPIKIVDPHAYHLDCVVFAVDAAHVMVCIDLVEPERLRQIEQHCTVLDIAYEEALAMATNCVRVGDHLAAQTNISLYGPDADMYHFEKRKIAKLEAITTRLGLQLRLFDLTEFRKSGAALSCLVMRLNHAISA